ncbi:MAG: sigma-54-dependent Fis family transcriptional regulator [Cyclobacteriaceae bacterium]
MLKKGNILVVDDNTSILEALQMLLKFKYENVSCISNPNRLVTLLKKEHFDVIILDMNFSAGVNSGNEGLYWLKEILKIDPSISVITITAYGDVNLAVKSLKLGAADFILKPWDNKKLMATVESSLKLKKSKSKVEVSPQSLDIPKPKSLTNKSELIGSSPAFVQVMEMVSKVAKTDANVLITGENGTGKELIAREIHSQSERAGEQMVSLDLGAVSNTLIESELFGHMKGSFTDAVNDRKGKFEEANNGTLFLDEIGNLLLESQVKLLAAIQNRTVTPVGSNKAIPINIRLVCATNANLESMSQSGEFRQDLLYRVNTIEIKLPPLRDRVEDIPKLAEHFLKVYSDKYMKRGLSVGAEVKENLINYSWPGNIRELQHMMEKAVILSTGEELSAADFNFKTNLPNPSSSNPKTLEEMEKLMIIEVVSKHDGNMSLAADELGVARQTLYNKIKRFDLEGEFEHYGK